MRFQLRYLQHNLELPEGEFTVGRHATCQLSLDDALVSRKHAIFHVTGDAVILEDLQSRNGVTVNGGRIEGRTPLRLGDVVGIGAQELTLLAEAPQSTGRSVLKRTMPRIPVDANPVRGSRTPPPADMPILNPSEPPPSGGIEEVTTELSMVRRAETFALLGGVVEKALAMGRTSEAERLLASPLADIIEASRSGRRMSASLVDLAARFSAKLATATGKGTWADYVIELYTHQHRPCPAPVIEELYTAFRRVAAIDVPRLRAYIEDLRSRLSTLSPTERFLFQRLEGLERLAVLR